LIPERIKEKTRKFALLFNYDRSSTSKYPKQHASIKNWKEQKRFECQVGVVLSQHAYGSHPHWIGVTGISTTKKREMEISQALQCLQVFVVHYLGRFFSVVVEKVLITISSYRLV
jgi:hypothetical protein